MTDNRRLTPEKQRWVDQCQGLVRTLATRIHTRLPASVNYDDVVAYGQIGLLQAAHGFEPELGVAFQTFAYYRIRGAIYDGLDKMSWTSRAVRQRLKAEQMSALLMERQVEMRWREAARQASLAADAEWLVRNTQNLTIVHLISENSGEGEASSEVADSGDSPEELASHRELCAKLTSLIELLPEDEKTLIRLTYFEEKSITEAAESLGKSKSWGSRTHSRILERLARGLMPEGNLV